MDWVIQKNAIEKSLLIAKLLGCTDISSQKNVLEFLQTTDKSLESFYEKMILTLTPDERRRGLPIIFKPCIEADLVNIKKCIGILFKFIINLFYSQMQLLLNHQLI